MRKFLLYFFFLTTLSNINAQGFSLIYESIDETCFADGLIHVVSVNGTTGATIDYELFKLPNETVPLAMGTGSDFPFEGLNQGNYKIEATQYVDGEVIGTAEVFVTVNNAMVLISASSIDIISDLSCNEGTITVNLLQGVAEYYSLSIYDYISESYTQIVDSQTSNQFYITSENYSISGGSYLITIKDATCGSEINISYTFVNELYVDIWQEVYCDNQDIVTMQAFGGMEPYTYQLIDTDDLGNTIVITDNGENNIFLNVGFGLKMYMVTDGCGYSTILQTYFEENDNGDLFFSSQAQIDSFSNLDCEVISGNLTISGSDITDLSGLSNITHINGDLIIIDCPLLTNLDAFVSLVSLGGSFVSGKIMNPEDQSTGGLLKIENNPLLEDVSGLANIASDTIAELVIIDNPILSICSLSNFCAYLSDQDNVRTIEGNTDDCLDNQSVMVACALMSVDVNNIESVHVYPNPVNHHLNFSKQVNTITLTDLTGKILLVRNNTDQIDMSIFQTGVYLITIEQDNQSKEISKIIKQ